jgi:D-serine deaminase-like pyridoxal phosphate-dependent protein
MKKKMEHPFVSRITRPTLILDKTRALRNIERMANKARDCGVRFRPHFKTHQSAQIGDWFKDYGVDAITVSSIEMAEYFADHGWRDITVAFPVNWREIDSVNTLAARLRLHLLVDSEETVQFLRQHLTHNVHIWVDIDTGYRRTGVRWNDSERILGIVQAIAASSQLSFDGLLTHTGQAYYARSKAQVMDIHRDTIQKMKRARDDLTSQGFGVTELSIGDTPCCSLVDDLSDADEIRPGNFVMYDLTQWHIGACQEHDIAVALVCPVVAKYPDRNEITIYGGAVHLSRDSVPHEDSTQTFGYVAPLTDKGWGPLNKNVYLSRLSQEVGTIKATDEFLQHVRVGSVLAVLPVHSCMTISAMRRYNTIDGEVIRCVG